MTSLPIKRDAPDLPVQAISAGESKRDWVYRQLLAAIEQGLLRPGDTVPSTRSLSGRWKVSRGIVELAFEQLLHEGHIQSFPGKGSRVSGFDPAQFHRATELPLGAAAPSVAAPEEGRSGRSSEATAAAPMVQSGRPFIARLPDVGVLDLGRWRRAVAHAAKGLNPHMLADLSPQGLLPLREAICRHLAVTRGIRCRSDEVIVVTGIRHAIDLCCETLVGLEQAIGVEDPGYPGAEAIFRLRNRRTIPVAVDEDGLRVDHLRRHAEVAMVYVTPAHQAPTGVTLSPARRVELLDWAKKENAWILEDDYDSDFNYEAAPLAALRSIDAHRRVIFCGSFNKALFPGLRIGYIVAPQEIASTLVDARAATGRSNSAMDQLTLVEFIGSGDFARHLKTARQAYLARRDTVLSAIQRASNGSLRTSGTHAGFHFLLRLPDGLSETKAVQNAAAAGVSVQGLGEFCKHNPLPPTLVIGFTAITDSQAKWCGGELGRALAVPSLAK